MIEPENDETPSNGGDLQHPDYDVIDQIRFPSTDLEKSSEGRTHDPDPRDFLTEREDRSKQRG